MPIQTIIRSIEFKIYPNAQEVATLTSWLRTCCWIYNRALEQRIKAYQRRKQSVNYLDQQALLTEWRSRMPLLRDIPAQFERDALRRVDRGMKGFFRRCAAGQKPGFPRFRPHQRYNSLEQIQPGQFIRERSIFVPGIGEIRAKGRFDATGTQKGIRIIRRASGWYALVLMQQKQTIAIVAPINVCGIDVGLSSFATLDNGEKIGNQRFFCKAEKKMKRAQQRLSRCQKGSKRRQKAKHRVSRLYEKVVRQRKGFAHRLSRELVNRFDGIALEKLNVAGMACSKLSKSILDAAWSLFIWYVAFKAENAGKQCVLVDPRGTSQECPQCGTVAAKKLSERIHRCNACSLVIDRDTASAMVIRDRAFRRGSRGDLIRPLAPEAAGSVKREV